MVMMLNLNVIENITVLYERYSYLLCRSVTYYSLTYKTCFPCYDIKMKIMSDSNILDNEEEPEQRSFTKMKNEDYFDVYRKLQRI